MQLGGDSYIYYINTLLSENKWINLEEQVTPAHAVSRPTRRTYEKGEWITRTPISADDIVAFEVRKPDLTRAEWSVTGGRLRGQNRKYNFARLGTPHDCTRNKNDIIR
ncbi:hypothetical protein MGG_13430 [Pyricularia oryzae 70-15]|uniref:Uncharacterized protein n=1 Tax=Pyricularia oryzae (strain 70-15 / ATCC MYA-4617 / FGSC 8958) TaxID=242507 RepID=G4N2K9_PYRO7|nr:uncharacterized protein MGG_13430 [Pyricularia oryzae 70-15]EHA51718.1 hypothetical protein MGG_13430 [Pyricularia oryzae 70-15]KAI7911861.1 hypothetical protein M9X92_010340 [Pyricularia oryzae]KAI7912901.1 hypothetical protein M0657_010261 [Pyricularia oryzae]